MLRYERQTPKAGLLSSNPQKLWNAWISFQREGLPKIYQLLKTLCVQRYIFLPHLHVSFRIRHGLFTSRQSFRHLTLQSPGDLWTLAWSNISSTFFFGKHWSPIQKPQSDFGKETCGATFWDLNSTGQCLNNYFENRAFSCFLAWVEKIQVSSSNLKGWDY